MKPLKVFCKGVISASVLALSTFILFWPILLVGVVKLIPWRGLQQQCSQVLTHIATLWVAINTAVVAAMQEVPWEIDLQAELSRRHWYLVVCNHQSWADILILQSALLGRVPFLKFFLKQELIWVPLIGFAWWAMDMPFMKRYTAAELRKNPALKGKDLETTRRACEKFADTPVSIINFLEGTRFTPEKHQRTQSPYTHLLKPKAGGAGFVVGAMGSQLDTLLNVTLYYQHPEPGFWQLLNGTLGKVVVVIETHPIPGHFSGANYLADPGFKMEFQRWITGIWQAKDERLKKLHQAHAPQAR